MCVASPPDADVVIVGGGPAGSASALWCARHGLHVVVLEREVFPRHRPGETLPPGVEPLFAQLGVAEAIVAAGFTRHSGTWVTWAGPRRFDPFGHDSGGSWYGFQAPREQLDQFLLGAVSGPNAVVRQPSRALHPLRDHDRVIGVATSDGPLFARWVIDAGGGAHWLARLLADPRCGRIGHVLLIQVHYPQRGRCVSDARRVGQVERRGPSPVAHRVGLS